MATPMMDCARKIHEEFTDGRLKVVVFTDFEPATTQNFTPSFATLFNCEPNTEDTVRKALEFLDTTGALDVQYDLKHGPISGTKGKVSPAEYEITVQLN